MGRPGTTPPGAGGHADTSLCVRHPTLCQARTRLYRDGVLKAEGFPVTEISDHLRVEGVTVWLDLHDPGVEDLAVLTEEFGLHPLVVEDAVLRHERPKLDRYPDHLFLSAYAVHLDETTAELASSELAAFITPRAPITVRKDEGFDVDALVARWDGSPDLRVHGVGYLLHGLLDDIVDGHFVAVQSLDDQIEQLQDQLFAEDGAGIEVQRRSFQLRKSLVLLRRVVLPMREVVNTLMRRDIHLVDEEMTHYYLDVYDHVLRATHEEADRLGGDHRHPDGRHRLLRAEHPLPGLRAGVGRRRQRGRHRHDERRPVRHVPAQGWLWSPRVGLPLRR